MKFYSILGFILSASVVNKSNAEIVHFNYTGQLEFIYATNLNGDKFEPNYHNECQSKLKDFLNTPFVVNFIIDNDRSAPSSASLQYQGFDISFNGSFRDKTQTYIFKTDKLPESFLNLNIKSISLNLDKEMLESHVGFNFKGMKVKSKSCWHPNSCVHHTEYYRCVVSTTFKNLF